MTSRTVKKGFSLPEVMVAMVVIVMVVYAATTLLVSSMRSNVSNVNTMIAYGLAQEGLEAVRNIRDSDWLLGANFNGTIGSGKTPTYIWGMPLPSLINDVGYYTVDMNEVAGVSGMRFSVSQLPTVAPWRLTKLSKDEVEKGVATKLYKKEIPVPKEVRYTHVSSTRSRFAVGLGKTTATPFRRYIMITPVNYVVAEGVASLTSAFTGIAAPPVKKLRVASVVEWEEMGRTRKVRMDTELTDWMK